MTKGGSSEDLLKIADMLVMVFCKSASSHGDKTQQDTTVGK